MDDIYVRSRCLVKASSPTCKLTTQELKIAVIRTTILEKKWALASPQRPHIIQPSSSSQVVDVARNDICHAKLLIHNRVVTFSLSSIVCFDICSGKLVDAYDLGMQDIRGLICSDEISGDSFAVVLGRVSNCR